MMKHIAGAICTLFLAACSSMPAAQMSYGDRAGPQLAPTNPNDPRFHQRAFYVDGDSMPAWMKAVPRSNQ